LNVLHYLKDLHFFGSLAWWCVPVIPALRQEGAIFEASFKILSKKAKKKKRFTLKV
jgi:hypothetical protein